MFSRVLICFFMALTLQGTVGLRIKRGGMPFGSHDESKGSSSEVSIGRGEGKQVDENVMSPDGKCTGKRSSAKPHETHLIDEPNRERGDRAIKIHGEYVPVPKKDNTAIVDKSEGSAGDGKSDKKVSRKEVSDENPNEAAVKRREDFTDTGDFKHVHAAVAGEDARKSEVKLDMKKAFKPDLDIFLYSNMPQLYKIPPFYEMFNGKEELSPYEHLYPYKWLQRRSPIQSAFEIANMMVKVGLDELESDDYSEQMPFFETGKINHRLDRALEKSNFCPLHSLQKPLDSSGVGQKVVQVCSCHLMKKSPEDEHDHPAVGKTQELDKKSFSAETSHAN